MTSTWNGLHHLALYTRDLESTLAFYRDVMGFAIGDIADSPRGRHAFVHLEPLDSGRPGLHFWEHPDLPERDIEANRTSFNSGEGVLAHFAVYLPDRDAEEALRTRLTAAGHAIVEFDRLGTFAVWEPNGIMLEIVPPRYDELYPH